MPGAPRRTHELGQFTAARNQKVGGHAQACDLRKKWMVSWIEPVGEQSGDVGAAELPRWQADVVDDDQFDRRADRSRVGIRGRQTARTSVPPGVRNG